MKRPLWSMFGILIVAVGGLGAVLGLGWKPALGLDLQGGVAIVLAPKNDVPSETLDQSIEILRNRVDALGVAEPEITRQGNTIVVQLPGVTDRARARQIIGQTAELRFRPVLNTLAVPGSNLPEPPVDDATTTTQAGADGATSTTAGEESSLGQLQLIAQTETTEAGTTETTEAGTTETTSVPADVNDLITPREQDLPEATVILPELVDGQPVALYQLGPAELTGSVVKTAAARFDAQWSVGVEFTASGSPQWDAMAAKYVGQRIAIVLDGVVISAPTINVAEYNGQAVISGNFDEGDAKDLALVLRFGALPVQLEELTVQEVSATLGHDALSAGITAGLVGLALVALYVVAYYRLLGVIALISLSISGALLWIIIAYLGEKQGLALSLSGITGIIVSIGVAVDSNVVYYERVKEEFKGGKTLRTAVDQAFKRSFSTILKADFASLIGAVLLYMLTVGPVRGFALFLGISTMLDLVASWFFMRPAALYLGRNKRFGTPRLLGMPIMEVNQ